VVVLCLHLALALGKELRVQGDLTLLLGFSGGDGLLVGELSGCVSRRLFRLLLGSHGSKLLLVRLSVGYDLGLEFSLLPVFISFLGSHTSLSGRMPFHVTCCGFLGLLECGECLRFFGFGGSLLHVELGNVLLKCSLSSFGSLDISLLGIEQCLCLASFLGSGLSRFSGVGKSLRLLGFDQVGTGLVLGSSGFALLLIQTVRLVTLGFGLGAGRLSHGLSTLFSRLLLRFEAELFGRFPLVFNALSLFL
jgi:hypothetical protein